jgi:hypothetical protein
MKFIEPIIDIKTKPTKPIKIPIHFPCIICSSVEHKSKECPRKIEVQNMFRTKLVSYNIITSLKSPKLDNVLVNVVVVVTTYSQQLEQHVLKERKFVKAKGVED